MQIEITVPTITLRIDQTALEEAICERLNISDDSTSPEEMAKHLSPEALKAELLRQIKTGQMDLVEMMVEKFDFSAKTLNKKLKVVVK